MAERRAALYAIVEAQQPMTVRQVFYQATVRGVIEKTENGYAKVQNLLADMRRAGELPYQWLADNTRWMRKPRTYRGPRQALLHTARFYRTSLWEEADAYAAGQFHLRAAIGRHIGISRGVVASPDDIVITSGTQQALDVLARVLLAPGDRIAVEDPGYLPPTRLFQSLRPCGRGAGRSRRLGCRRAAARSPGHLCHAFPSISARRYDDATPATGAAGMGGAQRCGDYRGRL
jgi:hypothetical protein